MRSTELFEGALGRSTHAATSLRILRVLRLTQRPLRHAELENALALARHESRDACKWLVEHGYITSSLADRASGARATPCWSLAAKGHEWIRSEDQRRPGRNATRGAGSRRASE